MRLGICSRTNDVVEPLSKPQWYINCNNKANNNMEKNNMENNNMAKKALDAVIDEKKKIEIIPKQYAADWKRWSFISFYLAL